MVSGLGQDIDSHQGVKGPERTRFRAVSDGSQDAQFPGGPGGQDIDSHQDVGRVPVRERPRFRAVSEATAARPGGMGPTSVHVNAESVRLTTVALPASHKTPYLEVGGWWLEIVRFQVVGCRL